VPAAGHDDQSLAAHSRRQLQAAGGGWRAHGRGSAGGTIRFAGLSGKAIAWDVGRLSRPCALRDMRRGDAAQVTS
jgi:hypothetical protein